MSNVVISRNYVAPERLAFIDETRKKWDAELPSGCKRWSRGDVIAVMAGIAIDNRMRDAQREAEQQRTDAARLTSAASTV